MNPTSSEIEAAIRGSGQKTPLYRGIQAPTAPIAQRAADDARKQAVLAVPQTVQGFIDIFGPGEALSEVSFPVPFSQVPAMSFGSELKPGTSVEKGNFPTISVVVVTWRTVPNGLTTAGWTGAVLAIVTTGPTGQNMTVHWQATGIASRSPGTAGDLEATL